MLYLALTQRPCTQITPARCCELAILPQHWDEQPCIYYFSFACHTLTEKRFIDTVIFRCALQLMLPVNQSATKNGGNSTRTKGSPLCWTKNRRTEYSTSLVILPQNVSMTYRTEVKTSLTDCKAWYKTSVELIPRRYTNMKVLYRYSR
ncbi:uncharacterized protein LOC144868774 [Branchiostoma floridae x Branchiostoma japonicum]|uniref:Uncharacterized protein n=1 Tax=Branchiostoma floridae TaxID=7739 RepID=C3Y3Q5_BRAFL|eukprot:XP_002608921.1 hypothetical protein BRAFLDRAFT_85514 [Branchiostoma floridae]